MPTELADILYRGQKAAAVYWNAERGCASFQYTPDFCNTGIHLAPLHMPLRNAPYEFPSLHASFLGLPGLLADGLPDTYGNTLINDWLRRQNRNPDDFSPVERLCYIGNRGMGALEFRPSLRKGTSKAEEVDVGHLAELAQEVLSKRQDLNTSLTEEGLNEIIRVGTSAGGARAKAVIVWNAETGEVRSGQADAPPGFTHWLLKFDGVTESFDGVQDPQGYGRIEYAYHRMALKAGITMSECRLFTENGRAHFMTRRFDRPGDGGKIHYASLFGLAHRAYSAPGTHAHSYEDLFEVLQKLDLSVADRKEAFRRMVFNVLARNCDDHSKNFGFLMPETGQWQLAPAFDITYAHNPGPGKWTATQQMSVHGKRRNITRQDLLNAGHHSGIATRPKLNQILDQVTEALSHWTSEAEQAGIPESQAAAIQNALASTNP
jgi:serine/threonine-protein kinase HipA